MTQNTIRGTARKAHTTAAGIYLERGYIYLTPEAWATLYSASSAKTLSASEYIASLITTEDGKTIKDSPHDSSTRISTN
jgi:hypothetical protein